MWTDDYYQYRTRMAVMRERIPLKGGDEYDALTKARKWYKYLTKPGIVKKIKKKYNKRFRQHNKLFDKADITYRDGDNT
jgi:hypothetical protein